LAREQLVKGSLRGSTVFGVPRAVVPNQGYETSFQEVREEFVLMRRDLSIYYSPATFCFVLQWINL